MTANACERLRARRPEPRCRSRADARRRARRNATGRRPDLPRLACRPHALVSKYCIIMPGDVMWMGTDGVRSDMKPGDTCEIEISGIGVLRNRVVAE